MSLANSLDRPAVLDRKVVHAGKVVFREGAEGDCAYVVQSGAIDIVRDAPEGPVTLGRLTAGAMFGEMALIDDAPRMATAVAVEATTLIVIKRETLRRKIENADPFIARLLLMFAGNLRSLTNDHVNRRPLPQWLEGSSLDMDYRPEEVSASLVRGPFRRKNGAAA